MYAYDSPRQEIHAIRSYLADLSEITTTHQLRRPNNAPHYRQTNVDDVNGAMADAFSMNVGIGQHLNNAKEQYRNQGLKLEEREAKIHRLEKEVNEWNSIPFSDTGP